jgi:hypothetical protein
MRKVALFLLLLSISAFALGPCDTVIYTVRVCDSGFVYIVQAKTLARVGCKYAVITVQGEIIWSDCAHVLKRTVKRHRCGCRRERGVW